MTTHVLPQKQRLIDFAWLDHPQATRRSAPLRNSRTLLLFALAGLCLLLPACDG